MRASGIYFPWKLTDDFEQADGSIPPDLAAALGPDVVPMLWDRLGGRHLVGGEWWSKGLPAFVELLVREKRERDGGLQERLLANEKEVQEIREGCLMALSEAAETESELHVEINELKIQLREAKAREDALRGVIQGTVGNPSQP
mgnify:CR=1 FL=1